MSFAALLTIAGIFTVHPGMYSDPAWGILAAEQHFAGMSQNILTAKHADPHDLARDQWGRVTYWAPLYQAAPYIFRSTGMSWGQAIRGTVLIAWLVGIFAWGRYFGTVLKWQPELGWLLVAFLLFRYTHNDLYMYDGGESLLWAVFPVVLWLNERAMRSHSRASGAYAAVAGSAASALFLVKYSGALSSVGLGVAWVAAAAQRRVRWRRTVAWLTGSVLALGAIMLAGFPGGLTPATEVRTGGESLLVLSPFLNWPLAMTDLDGLLRWLFMHPDRALIGEEGLLWLGLSFAIFLVLAVFTNGRQAPSRRPGESPEGVARRLAISVMATVPLELVVLLARGGAISPDARHVRIPALLALPYVFAALLNAARGHRGFQRLTSVLAIGAFFVIPAAYGGATLVGKAWLRGPAQAAQVGPDGIRLDLLGPSGNALAFYQELQARLGGRGVVFYLTSPDLAIALARERMLVVHADFVPLQQLAAAVYRGRPEGGVALVLPKHFEANGKREAIQRSFVDLTTWTSFTLSAAPEWIVWRGL